MQQMPLSINLCLVRGLVHISRSDSMAMMRIPIASIQETWHGISWHLTCIQAELEQTWMQVPVAELHMAWQVGGVTNLQEGGAAHGQVV